MADIDMPIGAQPDPALKKRLNEISKNVYAEAVSAVTQNVQNKFREAFESFEDQRWNTPKKASGDILRMDGNAASSSYLAVSLDPLSADTETAIETVARFGMPLEMAIGLSASQRTIGQEFSIEVVSEEASLPATDPIAITSISQTTTTLTVVTATPHGLVPGKRIGIADVADSRLNYPSLVVASLVSATSFTATAGPVGTIPSVTAGPFSSGFVYVRPSIGYAPNGTSMILEGSSATSASFYTRSSSGDSLMSGSVGGDQRTTISTTASVVAISSAYTVALLPTSEYRLVAMADGIQWFDGAVDTTGSLTSRYKRTQVVPDYSQFYKLRIRASNLRSLTRPIARIVSATKTGTTTATVVTDVPHGLTVTDQVNLFGSRDITNFPNVTAATAVASVVNATTFTIVWGGAVTATSYGGLVCRVNGGINQQGAASQNIQNVTVSGGLVSIQLNAALSGMIVGDLINLVGVGDASTGANLGVDGAYGIRNIFTGSPSTVELQPIGNTVNTIPASLAQTNCGGGILRRTDLRLSYVRIFDFERERVELTSRPVGDAANAVPVVVQNAPSVTQGTASNLKAQTEGTQAVDSTTLPNPVVVGLRAVTGNPSAVTGSGRPQAALATTIGAQIAKPYAIPEAGWNASLALTTTTATAIQAAAGAGLKRHTTALQAINTGGAAVDLIILDGATERWRLTLPVIVPVAFEFPTEIATTANTALNANLSAAGTVRANFQGYTAP